MKRYCKCTSKLMYMYIHIDSNRVIPNSLQLHASNTISALLGLITHPEYVIMLEGIFCVLCQLTCMLYVHVHVGWLRKCSGSEFMLLGIPFEKDQCW